MYATQIAFLLDLNQGSIKAWHDMDSIYKPLVFNWLKKYALQPVEAEDIAQEVMIFVMQNIDTFEHNGHIGAFRNWLRNVTVNICRNHLRKNQHQQSMYGNFTLMLEQLEDCDSNLTKIFNLEYDRRIVSYLLLQLQNAFEPQTLAAFQLNVLEGLSAQEVADKLVISVASVHVAKSRVLRRLRSEAKGWLRELNIDEVLS